MRFDRAALAAAAILAAAPALAAPLDPNDYNAIGLISGDDIYLNTSTLDFNGNELGVLATPGGGAPDIAVYVFEDGSEIGNVTVTGTLPVAILFKGAGTIAGGIDVSGGLPAGVAGGANGGAPSSPGEGTGGGGSASGPGAGGSFGSLGQLGGAGGGALEIGALTNLIIAAGAVIDADGAAGGDGDGGGSGNPYGSFGGGGGSGGGILLHGYSIDIVASAMITANGGNPGKLGIPGQAGCGGGGRIAILYNSAGSYSNEGTVEAKPGDDGTGENSGTACHPTDPLDTVSVLSSPEIGGEPLQPVPVPASLPLLATALAGLEMLRRGRKSS